MDLLKDIYSWASLQPMFIKLGMVILLGAGVLYVFGYIMSILFWFFLRATEDPSTRHRITPEERLGVQKGTGKNL
jgi:hypothetical protein